MEFEDGSKLKLYPSLTYIGEGIACGVYSLVERFIGIWARYSARDPPSLEGLLHALNMAEDIKSRIPRTIDRNLTSFDLLNKILSSEDAKTMFNHEYKIYRDIKDKK